MIAAGADVNGHTVEGVTPLMAAVNSNPDAIPLLLAQGADLNASDQAGIGALHAAAAMGKADVVRLLVESGADKEQMTANGLTALRVAEAAGHPEIVEFLQ